MKLKQLPDDFFVEEATDVAPADQGPFALYRLEKRGWSTPDALAALRRRWRIEPRRISYGGLKDRHAWTIQYLTIFHGPRRDLHHPPSFPPPAGGEGLGWGVTHLGWTDAPYTSQDIRCNRFRLTLRNLSAEAAERAATALDRIAVEGVPNYFDDQRFGSVAGEGQEFIARLLVRGRFEAALRLALTAPYEFDRGPIKKEKALLRDRWGDWLALKEQLPRGHARSLVDYLRVHPDDFRGAVARLRPELRGLYLSAYQSHLWNRMLAHWLTHRLRPEQLRPVALRLGEVAVPHRPGRGAAGRVGRPPSAAAVVAAEAGTGRSVGGSGAVGCGGGGDGAAQLAGSRRAGVVLLEGRAGGLVHAGAPGPRNDGG